MRNRNGVCILGDEELREQVVEVRRVNDGVMSTKLVTGEFTLTFISVYVLYVSLDEDEKKSFWEALDKVVRDVPNIEKLFMEEYFNGRIGLSPRSYDDVYEGRIWFR